MFTDPFEIKFWDGIVEKFGEGESKFQIIFNEPISKGDIINDPSITFGEAYMTKKLEIKGSVQSVVESLYNNKESFLSKSEKYEKLIKKFKSTIKRSKDNIQFHYDIGNDFYKLWLDDSMNYSCGYFKNDTDSLNQAQSNKINHILNKLNLKEGQTLLDIGCGWGDLIISAAKQYKVKSTGITISEEQFENATERIKLEGLENLVEVKLQDYREIKNVSFDRIVSVGMLEHVGLESLSEYFHIVNDLLNDKGLSLLHCITAVNEGGNNTWIDKYIFPGGHVPAIKNIITDIADLELELIDVESLRRHYGKTLEHWAENFESVLPIVEKTKDETFIRMWRLYLNSCAASFNCGNINLHQILFAKGVNNDLPLTRDYMAK
ncbi:cyclopropane-fatty-acyl-phospholipid synthase family protein [Clostridium estertheticum]|nr:cyclopropane-fatty-acyl-phospholipid synthase family protein [Clostridium estertheticum]MBZ9614355.1 cyclopropane-fatty-acyl-phospholipid synthase family protein [Clostridium estertheticum subsp. laramiense]WAG75948.1 cyclopropane-fatty-acyl-phospholipid synthase family protein [Clostridium estertheticum]WLC81892.1 cyclopropane-fatty-acyl-phospholipid synthase family protein [Clostridium estertheticum]